MAIEIEQLKPITLASGDTLTQPVTVYDDDSDEDELKDLLGASVSWSLRRLTTGTVLLDEGDEGVSVDIDSDESLVTIELGKGATEGINGSFRQVLRVTDVEGRQNTSSGPFEIKRYD